MVGSDKPPVGVRLPKSETQGPQPLLNEDGFAVLDRETLRKLFKYDPKALENIRPLLEPDDDTDCVK